MTLRLDAILGADASGFVSGMAQASGASQQFARAASDASRTAGGGFSELTKTVKGIEGLLGSVKRRLTGGFAALGAGMVMPSIFNAAKSALIDFNQQLDQSRIAFGTFMGSGEKANAMLEKLQTFAAKTPFNFRDLLGTTQQMVAMGVAADDLIPRLTAIGDAASALGGSPEVMRRIQRALGQIQAKGRVQAEELMQLAEVGIPAYEYIATVLGVSIPQSLKMMERGQVSAATAITGLLDGMGKDFGGMMKKHSQTMMGALSTVQDYVSITVANMTRPLFEAVRGLFVAIANFLSTNDMKQRAQDFANAVRDAFVSAGTMAKQIWLQIQPTLESVYKLAINIGRMIANGWKTAQPAIQLVVGAIIGVTKAVKPVIDGISALTKKFKESKAAGIAVASGLLLKFTPLGGLIKKIAENMITMTAAGSAGDVFKMAKEGKKAFEGLATGANAAAGEIKDTQTMVMSTDGTFNSFAETAENTQKKVGMFGAASQVTTRMAAASWKTFGATFKAIMTSLKATMIAFISTIPLLIAMTVVMQWISGLGKKSKEAAARVKELTGALSEQVKQLYANEDAMKENAKKGVDFAEMFGKALEETGTDGKKLKEAFGGLNTSFDLDKLVGLSTNFEQVGSKMLQATGISKDLADAMANSVNATDRNSTAYVTLGDASVQLTEAQQGAWSSLEELQDQIEKTDFMKIIKDTQKAAIAEGHLTKGMIEEARVMAAREDGFASMSAVQQEFLVTQKAIELSLYYELDALAQNERAKADYNAMAGETFERHRTIIQQYDDLVKSQNDGKLSLEEFTGAVFAQSNVTKSWSRSLAEGKRDVNALFDSVETGGKDFENFNIAVMGLDDQLQKVFFEGQQLGYSTTDIGERMQILATEFVRSAEAAGYDASQVRLLLSGLEALSMMDAIGITIYTDLSSAQADLQRLLSALGNIIAIGAPMGTNLDSLMTRIKQAQAAVDSFTKTPPRKSGGGGGATATPEDPFAWIGDWVANIAQAANGFIQEDFIKPLVTATSAQIKDAFVKIFDSLKQLGVSEIPAFRSMIDAIKAQFDELAELADIRDVLVYNLTGAESALADLQQRFDDVAKAAGAFDSTITGSTAPVTTLLDQALAAQDRYRQLLDASENLRRQQTDLAMEVQKNVFQPVTAGASIGATRKLLRDAITFRDNLVALYERGFTPDVIQQVAQAGVINGNKIARSLLSMGEADFQEFLALRAEIAQVGTEAGAIAGTIVFGADIADAEGAVTEQQALVRQLFTDALAEARANLDAQTQIVNLLRQSLDSVTTQIAELVAAIRIDLYDAFASLLSGLPNGLSQLGGLTSSTQPTNTNIVINVNGSIISENQLIETVRQGLLSAQRSGRPVVV